MSDVKMVGIREFREAGFLQEANRLFFHPIGLALEVVIAEDGSERLGGVWDYRGDAEGVFFGELPPDARFKADAVAAEMGRHLAAREAMFGSAVQPLPEGGDGG